MEQSSLLVRFLTLHHKILGDFMEGGLCEGEINRGENYAAAVKALKDLVAEDCKVRFGDKHRTKLLANEIFPFGRLEGFLNVLADEYKGAEVLRDGVSQNHNVLHQISLSCPHSC